MNKCAALHPSSPARARLPAWPCPAPDASSISPASSFLNLSMPFELGVALQKVRLRCAMPWLLVEYPKSVYTVQPCTVDTVGEAAFSAVSGRVHQVRQPSFTICPILVCKEVCAHVQDEDEVHAHRREREDQRAAGAGERLPEQPRPARRRALHPGRGHRPHPHCAPSPLRTPSLCLALDYVIETSSAGGNTSSTRGLTVLQVGSTTYRALQMWRQAKQAATKGLVQTEI